MHPSPSWLYICRKRQTVIINSFWSLSLFFTLVGLVTLWHPGNLKITWYLLNCNFTQALNHFIYALKMNIPNFAYLSGYVPFSSTLHRPLAVHLMLCSQHMLTNFSALKEYRLSVDEYFSDLQIRFPKNICKSTGF